ncbi:MAG: hypothetical protein R2854_12005 [Caldilineaceae bacterium]
MLDASTGQNAISQLPGLHDAAGGPARPHQAGRHHKGGAVLSIKHQLGAVPCALWARAKKLGDFAYFDPVAFVEGLLGE